MNQDKAIQIHNPNKLNIVEYFIQSSKMVKIRDLDFEKDEFGKKINILFDQIISLISITSEIDLFQETAIENCLKQVHSDLSLNEVYKAFEMDCFGKLGEPTNPYNNFNVTYFTRVLMRYKEFKRKTRQNNTRVFNKVLEPSKPSKNEQISIVNDAILKQYNYYLEHNEIQQGNGYMNNVLKNLRTIEITQEQKTKLDNQAKSLTKRLNNKNNPYQNKLIIPLYSSHEFILKELLVLEFFKRVKENNGLDKFKIALEKRMNK